MAVTGIVSLNAKAERIAGKAFSVEENFAGENGVGVRRSRETNPTFVAKGNSERGVVAKIPGDGVAIDVEIAPGGIFVDAVVSDATVKRELETAGQVELVGGETLNEGLWFVIAREPGGPDLDGHVRVFCRAAVSAEIHQEITEPPGAAAVGEAATDKPNFVATVHGEGRVDGVEGGRIRHASAGGHGYQISDIRYRGKTETGEHCARLVLICLPDAMVEILRSPSLSLRASKLRSAFVLCQAQPSNSAGRSRSGG